MTPGKAFWLTATGVATFVVAVIAAAGMVVWLDLEPPERAQLAALFPAPRVGLLVLFLIALIGGIFGIVRRWFRRSVEPVRRLTEAAQLIAASNPEYRIALEGSEETRQAAEAVNALAQRRCELQREVDETTKAAKASVEAEKNRLAALMSELQQSVLVCNREGRILLYNAAARDLLARDAEHGADGALVGLGRSVFGVIDRGLILHALDSIERQLERGAQAGTQPGAQFVTTTPAGGLLRVQAAPVLASERQGEMETTPPQPLAGFVLLLSDVTEAVESDRKRIALMQALSESTRGALASIRAAIENLVDYPGMDAARRERFTGVIRDEAVRLSERLNAVSSDFSEQLKSQWPLEDMRGEDLITLARGRIEKRLALLTKLEDVDPQVWVKVDSFSVAQGISYLAARLKDEFRIREVCFRLTRGERHGHLDMLWRGAPLSLETVFAWENDPFEMGGEASPLTWKQVVARHGGEAWYRCDLPAQTAYFRLLLPLATEARGVRAAATGSRPEFYDFDLFKLSAAKTALDERRLSELAYTVFDTETTGLDPSQGDEIIAIGAVRIVNGRLLSDETFEQLIDPRRPLSPASIAVHGITPERLGGQPTIEAVLPRFHRFVEDTVLIGHNAAFDLRFLQLKEAPTGVVFDQPVLDTLLLSALLHPHQESHSLEAIAQRLGVEIVERHTALGDALVTAEVFLRMIPLLLAAGIETLGQARAAAQRTYYARLSY
jgi:DNA polymerase-3 subunit epsilon